MDSHVSDAGNGAGVAPVASCGGELAGLRRESRTGRSFGAGLGAFERGDEAAPHGVVGWTRG